MADLEKPFPFHQAKAWKEQEALRNPVPDRKRGFRLPDTIKVDRVVAERQRRQFAGIIPDQAKHGIEWSMHFAIPQFMNTLLINGTSGPPSMTEELSFATSLIALLVRPSQSGTP